MSEPNDGLTQFQSIKTVLAGEIALVRPDGCMVRDADGTEVFRRAPDGMYDRYEPSAGDFWLIYEDGYQSISPRESFMAGYLPIDLFDAIMTVGMDEDGLDDELAAIEKRLTRLEQKVGVNTGYGDSYVSPSARGS